MFGARPKNSSPWNRLIISTLVIIFALLALNTFLSFEIKKRSRTGPNMTVKHDVARLTAALKAYYGEYGRWPDFTGDGLFLDEKRQAQLLLTLSYVGTVVFLNNEERPPKILGVLNGKDEANNPRKIIFFDGKMATKALLSGGRYCDGFNPETGAFLDPWGNPYRIAIDADGDGLITSPYTDEAPVRTGVIVWSLGKDGKQGSPANPHTYKGSDDVTSWQ